MKVFAPYARILSHEERHDALGGQFHQALLIAQQELVRSGAEEEDV